MKIAGALAAALILAGCQEREGPAAPAGNAAAPAAAPSREGKAPVPPPAKAPARPRAAPFSATGYALTGTEPFWGGTLTGTRVRYMTPENQFGDVVETRLSFASGSETYSGSHRGQPFVLTLSGGPCSDGMSDHVYAYTAQLRVLGETRQGCADPQ